MNKGDGNESGRAGQDLPDRGTVKGRAPDKDWYRKWQERLRKQENEGPR